MAYIVQKADMTGHWVDMLVTQEGYPAYQMYKDIEKQMGKNNVRIIQQ